MESGTEGVNGPTVGRTMKNSTAQPVVQQLCRPTTLLQCVRAVQYCTVNVRIS